MKLTHSLLLIPALATNLSAVVLIDSFNNGDFNITQSGTTGGNTGGGAATVVTVSGSGILGGTREVRVHNTAGTGDNTAFNNFFGAFDWSMDAAATGHFHLYYGAARNGGAGPQLNADISYDNAFAIYIANTDIAGDVKITVTTNGGAGAGGGTWELTKEITGGINAPLNPVEFLFAKNDAAAIVTGTLDWSDVDGITVEAAEDLSSADWVFSQIRAIPEPSSTALLGLGGLAFAMRRRRK